MKAAILCLLVLAAVGCMGQQLQQPAMSMAGEVLTVGMNKQEATKKLSVCCKTVPLGKNAVIVADKENINKSFGMVYFQNDKVSGLAADKDWSPEPASYETGLALYRLVDGLTHGTPTQVTLYNYSQEAVNASSKYVIVRFANGRRIRMEIINPDPGQHFAKGVAISECVGDCVDWP